MFSELSPPYATIVADPPWHYDAFASDPGSALPLATLAAPDAWLFLWTTNRYLPESFGLLAGWGFRYRQTFVWHKTGNPTPFGGTLAPNHAEFLLVASCGSPSLRDRVGGSVIAAQKPSTHSAKPAAFMDVIEKCCEGPYVELFSREPRFGWDSWGYGYESERVS